MEYSFCDLHSQQLIVADILVVFVTTHTTKGYLYCTMKPKLKSQEKEDSVPWLLSRRLWLALLGFLGFVFLYTHRVGMSVAIVCMVNQTAVTMEGESQISSFMNSSHYSNNSLTDEDYCVLQSENQDDHVDGPFVWSKKWQGHVLGSFFYGYLVSQVPAGLLAQRFGGKWVFAAFYLVSTIGTILTPIAARTNFASLIVTRVFIGIGSGGIFPSMNCMWSHWAPPLERSMLAGISYAGMMMGNVVALPVSGVLCKHGFDGGWASVFYVFGILSLVWLLMWILLVSDTPSSCRHITNKEKIYIHDSLMGQTTKEKKFKTPWLSIAKSPAMWAILVANFTSDWGLYTLLTNIPTYMKEVLKFDVQSNGMYSALPYVGMWVNMNITPVIADKLRSSGILSTGSTRKLCTAIGHIGAGVFLLGLMFVPCTQPHLAVGLLVCSVTLSGTSYTGFLVNHMDIAPQYAGTLFGITNCLSAMSGFIAPYVAAVLTQNQSRGEWQIVFLIAAVMYGIGAVFYILLGSGEIQPWAFGDKLPVIELLNENEKQEILTGTEDDCIDIPVNNQKHSC